MTDLFENETTPETQPEPAKPQSDPLEDIMGEGKKYKTADDVARAIREKDAFIEKLKSENAQMRGSLSAAEKEAERARTVEEVVQQLSQTSRTEDPDGNQPSLDLHDVEKLVESRVPELVAAREEQRTRAANREKAKIALLDKFAGDGQKAKEFFQAEASRLGLSTEQLTGISEDSPDAFARMLTLDATKPTPHSGPTALRTTVNTEANVSAPAER